MYFFFLIFTRKNRLVPSYNFLTILGPTAVGKTLLAARLASRLGGEVISADSRQVYRDMNIGTGKDLEDYMVNGYRIPVHLIDIVDAGTQYNLFEYQRDFLAVLEDMRRRGKFPVLCGGSGLYLEAVLNNYRLVQVPHNDLLQQKLKGKNLQELTEILRTLKPSLHNTTDIVSEKRVVRAIEIEEFLQRHPGKRAPLPHLDSLIVGISQDVETRRRLISQRLHQRLNNGMIEEVKQLLGRGIAPEALTYYGLEYKFITLYLTGTLSRDEMTGKLNTAIHQFAKRQMTWFRKMERAGTPIRWIDGSLPIEEKISLVLNWLGYAYPPTQAAP